MCMCHIGGMDIIIVGMMVNNPSAQSREYNDTISHLHLVGYFFNFFF